MDSKKETDGFVRVEINKIPKHTPIDKVFNGRDYLMEKIFREEVRRKETEFLECAKSMDLIKAIDYSKELQVARTNVILCNRKTRHIIRNSDIDLSLTVIIVSDYIEDGTTYVITDEKTKREFLENIDLKHSNPWYRGGEI